MTKLSISNIAWPFNEEKNFLIKIKEWGCSGLEIAPNKIWAEPVIASDDDLNVYKSMVKNYGLEISALQALLYTRQDLGLFKDLQTDKETTKYLKNLCRVAGKLGAKILVFGSPSNRKRGDITYDKAFERAADMFTKVADEAEKYGVFMCIEPATPDETDFINTAYEGYKLVDMVNKPGFGLHLDAKALYFENADFYNIIKTVFNKFLHFHICDTGLAEVNSTGSVNHKILSDALKQSGYNNYVSIEMRTQPDYFHAVKNSIKYSNKVYIKNQ